MLYELWARGFPKFVLSGEYLNKPFQRYQQKYKKTLAVKLGNGSGLTEAELTKGITFVEKLDKLCPHFVRLDLLYGERHNVRPPTIFNMGIDGLPEVRIAPNDEH